MTTFEQVREIKDKYPEVTFYNDVLANDSIKVISGILNKMESDERDSISEVEVNHLLRRYYNNEVTFGYLCICAI